MAKEWKELREELNISIEEESLIKLERDLIKTMIKIREEKGVTQAELAEICKVKQPVIARLESGTHSPRVDSLLKVLVPLGYTLQIVPRR
ncbi:MAG: helix-turn-helix domain-containing protein [Lachnospiraceae bacterium]